MIRSNFHKDESTALMETIDRNVNAEGVDSMTQIEAIIALTHAVLYVGDQIIEASRR
jgi:hypothetical protein